MSSFGLSGDTLIWTAYGLRPLAALAGGVSQFFCQRRNVYGWHEATVVKVGTAPLLAITLGRGTATKVIYSTAGQTWLIPVRANESRNESRPVLGCQLQEGDRLLTVRPKSRLTKIRPSPFGIAAGIVFGDGHAHSGRTTSELTLYGDKRELAHYFAGCQQTTGTTLTGLPTVVIHSLPRFLKAIPDVNEAASYLYGWLAGYFATDGHLDKRGRLSISSAVRENLEIAQTIAARLGIGVGDVRKHMRIGIGQTQPTAMYMLQLNNGTLRDDFVIRDSQRNRWRPSAPYTSSWVIRSVEATQRVQEVYTLQPDLIDTLVIDGFIAVRT